MREIAERAEINKTTFYAHYETVYDLVDQLEQEAVAEVISQLNTAQGLLSSPRAFVKDIYTLLFSDRKDFSSCTLPATFTSSFKYTPLGSQRFLQWSKLSYADGYIVYKYDQKANKYTRVKKITSNKTNFCFVPNLRRGYGYRVLAYMKYNGKIYYGALSKAPIKNTSLTGTITDSSVNLRAKAGTNSRVVRTLARGSKVKISTEIK